MLSKVGRTAMRHGRPAVRSLASVSHGRAGEAYLLSAEQKERFNTDGFALLPDLLTAEEVLVLSRAFDEFSAGNVEVPGRDFCDMSSGYEETSSGRQIADVVPQLSVVNFMLPTKYMPSLAGNVYERLAANIAAQLFPSTTMLKDYDQLLDKNPHRPGAEFAWHQDLAYWPPTPDTRTVTVSLAIDSTTAENGCLQFVKGSHREAKLREHAPLRGTRDDGHALVAQVRDDDDVVKVEVPSGSATIHNERVVHGSGGNNSDGHRRTYVVAFRTKDTVELERSAGFTHSHNDDVNWDTFNQWQRE